MPASNLFQPLQHHMCTHVIMMGPGVEPTPEGALVEMSGSKWLMKLNGIPMDEDSSVLEGGSVQWGRDIKPVVQPSGICPEGQTVVHF